jgi:hypothetical protein
MLLSSVPYEVHRVGALVLFNTENETVEDDEVRDVNQRTVVHYDENNQACDILG